MTARLLLVLLICSQVMVAQWVNLADQTSSRLVAAPSVGSADLQEKDYAWGDVDLDGDIDLICVRKAPWTTTGRFANVLFLNELGVLTDRTMQFASASTVSGSSGFLDLTNDRDVALADVTGDGWLDIITATTLSGAEPKYISHPRIYVNQGNDPAGTWLGFTFDDENRVPTMPAEPRFCSVSVGDVDGDGDVDLYFADYDQGGTRPVDLNDRLWINDGTGYFSDQSMQRMSAVMLDSSFGMSSVIADMNGDGKLDIVKDDALNAPQGVSISYNDGSTQGFFASYELVHNFSPYFISVGDLNNDGTLDLVITDHGADRYRLNLGNGSDGLADFGAAHTFSFSGGGSDDGFGSNSLIVDLNNDSWNDVLIADVDVDIPGCTRRMHIYRNLGNAPTVTLMEEQLGGTVAGISTGQLAGTHDVAVFDIDGDGWNDLVVGRCTGTEVYINQPPVGVIFSWPQGLPFFIPPGQPFTFQIQLAGVGGSIPAPGATLHLAIAGGPMTAVTMTPLGGNLYEGTLPAVPNCIDEIQFHISAQDTTGTSYTDPSGAPSNVYEAVAALGTTVSFEDHMEGSVAGWTVVNTAVAIGGWEQAVPVGTIFGAEFAAPPNDADAGEIDIKCFVTGNGLVGGSSGAADLDGGPTDLISPVIDLSGTDGTITYSRWFFSTGGVTQDVMEVTVTGDGTSWTLVETVGGANNNSWKVASFRVSDFIVPTATVQVRFRVADTPNDSITEAGIDVFRVEKFLCDTCQQDIGFAGPGNATLSVCGGDLSSGTVATVTLTGVPAGTTTYTVATGTLNPLTIGSGTLIDPAPLLIIPLVANALGGWALPGLPGGGGPLTVYIQTVWFEAGLPGGIGFSNGVQIQFLP